MKWDLAHCNTLALGVHRDVILAGSLDDRQLHTLALEVETC